MKIRIISLLLSLAFLSMLSIEYISETTIAENTSPKTEKFVDDENLLIPSIIICKTDSKTLIPTYKKIFYSFTSNNTLFKPPISA